MGESLLEFENVFNFLTLQWWDFLIKSLQVSTECQKTLTNIPALSEVVNAFCLSITIKGANFIRALNLPFSYALLVQDKFINSTTMQVTI